MERIIEIINLWDPIGLFPMAPEDEYEIECKEIYYFLKGNRDIKATELSEKINDIFSQSFGEEYNREAKDFCPTVAQEILKFMT